MNKKKVWPTESKFKKLAAELALSWVIITQCQKCGHPVIKGYCCTYCGDSDPSGKE